MRTAGLLVLALILLPLGGARAASALININTANAAQLDSLPGIGPSKAAAIIDYRTTKGPFKKIDDIQNVKGIGPATFANLKNLITVGVVEEQPEAAPRVPAQPTSAPVSYTSRQTVKPAVTSNTIEHEEAVSAPTATPMVAAVGAALPAEEQTLTPPKSSSSDLFRSPWTFGLLGVIIVAGAIFILL